MGDLNLVCLTPEPSQPVRGPFRDSLEQGGFAVALERCRQELWWEVKSRGVQRGGVEGEEKSCRGTPVIRPVCSVWGKAQEECDQSLSVGPSVMQSLWG